MVFPTWQTGEGAEYLITNVAIEGDVGESPSVDLFTDGQNLDWPMWDCCGGSTPIEAMDDEEHGLTAEFSIGEAPTVMGFNTRTSAGGSGKPFDATSILENGVLQFDVKVMSNPNDPAAIWTMKIESNEGDTAVELPLTDAGDAPVAGEWKTYTFTFADLAGAGLDVSAIDVVMIFPAWGTGEGAVYRVDNAKMYDPSASAGDEITIFQDTAADMWSIWDCCGGSTPTEETDDAEHGTVAEFVIGATPTVMGFLADEGVSFDASAILANGVVQFEMKMVTPPNDPDSVWTFKIESTGAATAVELPLAQSVEGEVPVIGQWQTYTFTVQSLFDAGLDISDINVLMVFPAWGTGEGAVYRIDNVVIANP